MDPFDFFKKFWVIFSAHQTCGQQSLLFREIHPTSSYTLILGFNWNCFEENPKEPGKLYQLDLLSIFLFFFAKLKIYYFIYGEVGYEIIWAKRYRVNIIFLANQEGKLDLCKISQLWRKMGRMYLTVVTPMKAKQTYFQLFSFWKVFAH